MNNEMNDFVGNILQNKFNAYGYVLLSRTRRCTPICGAGMLLRCNWCRNIDAVELDTAGVFLLLRGHFEKDVFSGGPCLHMRVEASLGL